MSEGMIGLITVWIVLTAYYLGIVKKIKQSEQRQIEREEKFEKWLFEALYSIDQKVLLPPEKERIETEKDQEEVKGHVYRPSQDPHAIFRGEGGNYYESE